MAPSSCSSCGCPNVCRVPRAPRLVRLWGAVCDKCEHPRLFGSKTKKHPCPKPCKYCTPISDGRVREELQCSACRLPNGSRVITHERYIASVEKYISVWDEKTSTTIGGFATCKGCQQPRMMRRVYFCDCGGILLQKYRCRDCYRGYEQYDKFVDMDFSSSDESL